jgi:hypothetical protein
MNLHEHLTDTLDRVDETGPDLVRLTTVARTRGAGIRRRRTTGLVVAASVAALALTGGVLAAVSGPDGTAATIAAEPVTPDLLGPTAPTTGEGAVLALQWAVDQQRAGQASELAGQLPDVGGDYYVELRWDDADELGGSMVGLNVQHGRGMHATCGDPEYLTCHQSRLPDGSRMTTYQLAEDVSVGTGRYLVADLLRPDRIRVVASSNNGFEGPGGAWDLTRPAPPLTLDDLTAIVQQPMWGDTLPTAFIDAGQDVAGYRDLDDHGGWIHGPATDG